MPYVGLKMLLYAYTQRGPKGILPYCKGGGDNGESLEEGLDLIKLSLRGTPLRAGSKRIFF